LIFSRAGETVDLEKIKDDFAWLKSGINRKFEKAVD